MADIEDAFKQLLDRQPTDGDRQRLYRARDTLNIKPTDAVWRLLMIMEHYQTMYEEIPRQIAEAARNATETIRVTAEAQAKAAREETKKGLMKTVTEAVGATARQYARAEHFKWVSVAVSIVSITVLAVAWGENRRGQAQGLATGETRAKAECAYATKLSTWALTPDGVRAYELEKLGSLHDLVSCSGRGLDRKGDWCVAQPERGKSYRWRVAASDADRWGSATRDVAPSVVGRVAKSLQTLADHGRRPHVFNTRSTGSYATADFVGRCRQEGLSRLCREVNGSPSRCENGSRGAVRAGRWARTATRNQTGRRTSRHARHRRIQGT